MKAKTGVVLADRRPASLLAPTQSFSKGMAFGSQSCESEEHRRNTQDSRPLAQSSLHQICDLLKFFHLPKPLIKSCPEASSWLPRFYLSTYNIIIRKNQSWFHVHIIQLHHEQQTLGLVITSTFSIIRLNEGGILLRILCCRNS